MENPENGEIVLIDQPELKEKKVTKSINELYDELVKNNNDVKRNLVRTSVLLKNQIAVNLKSTYDLILEDIETLHNLDFGEDEEKTKEQDLRIMSGQTLIENFNLLINDICKFKVQSFEFLDQNKDFYSENNEDE